MIYRTRVSSGHLYYRRGYGALRSKDAVRIGHYSGQGYGKEGLLKGSSFLDGYFGEGQSYHV